MESNFHLKTQKQNQQFYIDLHGVFDGASAFELVNAIEKGYNCDNAVFIDTNRLTRTHSFGKAVLESHLPKSVLRAKLHFSGTRASEIIPKGCILYEKKKLTHHQCEGNCKNCTCQHNK